MTDLNYILQFIQGKKTPFYLYDVEKIRSNCSAFKAIPYPNLSLHYASMANSSKYFLKIILKEGLGIFVNSLEHLNMAIETGFKKESIVFTASSLEKETMIEAQKKAMFIHLDSLNQLQLWTSLFPNQRIGLRVNLVDAFNEEAGIKSGLFIGSKSRLGIDTESLKFIENPDMINGLHIYVGTNILDQDYFFEYYAKLIETAELFKNLEYVDFGGGFGIDSSMSQVFDTENFNKRLSELVHNFTLHRGRNIKLILEPGRIIAGDAGYFVCKVIDIKYRNDKQFIVSNASVSQFPRPLFYCNEAIHPVFLVSEQLIIKEQSIQKSAIVGCSTYSRDYLADDVFLPNAQIGDFVVFTQAGAYCASLFTKFLGFHEPDEYYI
ncbi:MAG: hypothetical protein PHT69_00765 [Bacteroidales bacterium]|nr:hypothetical protein [Bacteroidales bacterium]